MYCGHRGQSTLSACTNSTHKLAARPSGLSAYTIHAPGFFSNCKAPGDSTVYIYSHQRPGPCCSANKAEMVYTNRARLCFPGSSRVHVWVGAGPSGASHCGLLLLPLLLCLTPGFDCLQSTHTHTQYIYVVHTHTHTHADTHMQ